MPAILAFAVETAHKNNPCGGSEGPEQRENKKQDNDNSRTNQKHRLRFRLDSKYRRGRRHCSIFDFCYYTKHGLDYGFCAELTGNKFDGFLREVERNCEDFDPDYEAYRWIGYDGHGKCGAPYHIKDIVDEMEEAKKNFTDFYNSLKTALT